jgi:NAD(P)H-dependent FMN reductase
VTKNDLHIPVLLGTARQDRRSEKAARFVHGQVRRYGVSTELIDVRDFLTSATIPAWEDGAHTGSWRKAAARADGFIVVSPEYNHGYPGELKILLDAADDEYRRKPVAICGVSTSAFGGARMVEVLRLTLIELQMVPTPSAVYFARMKEIFNEAGVIQDSSYVQRVQEMLDELTWYARALKPAR